MVNNSSHFLKLSDIKLWIPGAKPINIIAMIKTFKKIMEAAEGLAGAARLSC
jgi:hypothetical protein